MERLLAGFYGGECAEADDCEDEELELMSNSAQPGVQLSHSQLVSILIRTDEVAAAERGGRTKTAHKQIQLLNEPTKKYRTHIAAAE